MHCARCALRSVWVFRTLHCPARGSRGRAGKRRCRAGKLRGEWKQHIALQHLALRLATGLGRMQLHGARMRARHSTTLARRYARFNSSWCTPRAMHNLFLSLGCGLPAALPCNLLVVSQHGAAAFVHWLRSLCNACTRSQSIAQPMHDAGAIGGGQRGRQWWRRR